mmetsp:Transcript_6823/g.17652  ORF Transcript_6823/g.17652 Transcript_6823/m.17652 type:complete len:238 (+) Transcript_6823:451-1164(+)
MVDRRLPQHLRPADALPGHRCAGRGASHHRRDAPARARPGQRVSQPVERPDEGHRVHVEPLLRRSDRLLVHQQAARARLPPHVRRARLRALLLHQARNRLPVLRHGRGGRSPVSPLHRQCRRRLRRPRPAVAGHDLLPHSRPEHRGPPDWFVDAAPPLFRGKGRAPQPRRGHRKRWRRHSEIVLRQDQVAGPGGEINPRSHHIHRTRLDHRSHVLHVNHRGAFNSLCKDRDRREKRN